MGVGCVKQRAGVIESIRWSSLRIAACGFAPGVRFEPHARRETASGDPALHASEPAVGL